MRAAHHHGRVFFVVCCVLWPFASMSYVGFGTKTLRKRLDCYVTLCPTLACTTPVASVVMASVGLLLMWRDVDGGRWLLVDSHAELLDVFKLALHSSHGGRLAFNRFLRGCICGTKVCKQFAVQCDQRIIIHGGHAIPMLRGWAPIWLTSAIASAQ